MDGKKIAAGAVALAALALGGGTALAAQQSTAPQAPQAAQAGQAAKQEDQQEPSFKGTVAAPPEANNSDAAEGKEGKGRDVAEKQKEAAESQQLRALAKIDQKTAEQSALRAVPGTVKGADLGNENGFVVYDVKIQDQGGKVTDVKVDADNGRVLAQEAGDNEGSKAAEDPEQNDG